MTFYTQRDNTKAMLRGITGVVIMLCLLSTRAFESIRTNHFAITDSIIHSVQCFNFFRMINVISFLILLTLFALSITFFSKFPLFGFFISTSSFFASGFAFFTLFVSFFGSFTFVCLLIFALRGSFCYDCLSHNRLLNRRLRLEPFVRPMRMSGSFYFNRKVEYVK